MKRYTKKMYIELRDLIYGGIDCVHTSTNGEPLVDFKVAISDSGEVRVSSSNGEWIEWLGNPNDITDANWHIYTLHTDGVSDVKEVLKRYFTEVINESGTAVTKAFKKMVFEEK